MAGVATVLVCAVIFEVIERRKRKLFKESVHDLAQRYIDQIKKGKVEREDDGRRTEPN